MKDWEKEKPNEEGLIWIYWMNEGQPMTRMAYWSKDGQVTDAHFGLVNYSTIRNKIKSWEYV